MGEDKARHAVGERCFADPLRSGKQKAMRHARRAIGGKERSLGLAVAEQHGGRARMRLIGFVVARLSSHWSQFPGLCFRCESLRSLPNLFRMKPRLNGSPDRVRDLLLGYARVDHHTAFRLLGGNAKKSIPQLLV
jgi:hypothetical protein